MNTEEMEMSEKALARVGAGLSALPPVRVETTSLGLEHLCQFLTRSGYFKDARDVSQAVVKVLYGQELGIGPVTAMMSIHIIEGKPAPSANLLGAIVKRSGRYDYRVVEHTDTAAELLFRERTPAGWEEIGRSRWTMQDAQRASLAGKGNWKSYPRAMLFARALSEGVRTHCPDLFGGAPVYTPEELGAEVNPETGEPVQVNRRTGEVIDVSSRVTAAAETQASYAGATRPASDNKHVVSQYCEEMGWEAPFKARFEAILGEEIPGKLSDMPADRWERLAETLWAAVHAKRRAFALYGEYCKLYDLSTNDRTQRLDTFRILLDQPHLETSKDLLPVEWEQLAEKLDAKVRAEQTGAAATEDAEEAEEAEPEASAGLPDDHDPFADQ